MSKVYVFMNSAPSTVAGDNKREVYWPASLGTRDYHDPSLRQTFGSKQAMRRYMAQHKLRDAGERVNPEKHVQGREKSKPQPHQHAIQAYIQSQGGAQGLLDRIQRGQGSFL